MRFWFTPPSRSAAALTRTVWCSATTAAIAEAGLPLLLFYLYQAAGGIAYGPHLLAELLARPEVLGIKVATLDSVITFQEIARLVRTHAPDQGADHRRGSLPRL